MRCGECCQEMRSNGIVGNGASIYTCSNCGSRYEIKQVSGPTKSLKRSVEKLYRVKRDILMSEHKHLKFDVLENTTVKRYQGFTYGCITPQGFPATLDGKNFFEIPMNAVEEYPA